MPKVKTKIIHFWKLATYMGKYVKDFAKIAAPIIELLEDTFEKIIWTIDCHASFRALKIILMEAHVLRIIDPLKAGLDLCT